MLLASGSWDGVVRLWDLATARQAMQIPLSANLHFSEDGRWLGFFWASEEHAQLLEFTPALEYSTLESNSGSDRPPGYFCAPSPDGRLLAVAMGDGVRLWDLSARREVALVPGFTASVVFEADGRALLTCSEREGLLQWPIYQSATNAAELLVGPPRHIEVPFTPLRISRSRDGRTLAIVSETAGKAAVLSPETESAHSLVVQHPQASFLALSPDAKWLATSGWHSDRVRLWNTQSGELVREWVVGRQTRVSFTPDSRQLIFGRGSEFSFLDVSTLEISRRLRREIGLYPKEVSTGRTVAQLEDPHGDRSNALAFSPDGTQLIVVATWASSVHLWDLRALRARLKPMGLDWDWPEFPPRGKSEESRTSLARAPLKVQVTSTDAR
jgi:WD40 repeat protein